MAIHKYWTRYGTVFHSDLCKDDWANMVYEKRTGYQLKLQRSAMRSFKQAEKKLGFEIKLTGSWRSCEYQSQLYRRDRYRYANPNSTLHTQGLAIDVSTALPNQEKIRQMLTQCGWKQSRPDDEPWHYSFYLRA